MELTPSWRVLATAILATLWMLGTASATPGGTRYKGQVLYRANKKPVPGVLVEIVEADDNQPGDDVLGTARTDAQGRFTLGVDTRGHEDLALVVSAVREFAASGGDRRSEGYEITTERTRLGFLMNPSSAKSNTILIERRRTRNAPDRD